MDCEVGKRGKQRRKGRVGEGERMEWVGLVRIRSNFISMLWAQTMLCCDQKHALQCKGCVGLNFGVYAVPNT